MSHKSPAKPTPQQIQFHDAEIGMFVHFDVAVYEQAQCGSGNFDLSQFNPEKLDTEQWCDVAESLGAKQIIHVAKHYSGFCNWQTDSTDYSVRNTPWRGGRGDIVADLAESCRKRGLRLGLYLSPGDQHHGALPGGICQTPEAQESYNKIYRQQLTELLTKYGPVCEVWFDGSIVVPVTDILDKYAPGVICFQGPSANIRWPGSEKGILPYPAWNSVNKNDAATGKSTAAHGQPDGDCWLPLEADTTIREHFWFCEEGGEKYLKSLEHLVEVYYQSVGHGGVLLLNSNPDRTGLIPHADATRTAELGDEIRKRFDKPLANTAGQGDELELTFDKPTQVDHVITMEDISQGELIREYVIEGLCDDGWRTLCEGSSVGHKKNDYFEAVKVSQLRIRCTKCAGPVTLKTFAAYLVGTTPKIDRNAISVCNPIIAAELEIAPGKSEHSLSLANQCRVPQRYEIEILPENSTCEFHVTRAGIRIDGTPQPTAIVQMSSDRVYDLNVSAWSASEIELMLEIESSQPTRASVMVR